MLLKHPSMISDAMSRPNPTAVAPASAPRPAGAPTCYSLTLFTQRWREVRDFYVHFLDATILSERADRYCEMTVGGLPICLRKAEFGETISYFHLYLAHPDCRRVLEELRRRGVIVTTVGPYANFRDPEGRVIKLSSEKTLIA
jgi:predicted enzyme related to lactoylglutathione lyase